MNVTLIAASDLNGVIGKDGGMPWPRSKTKSDLRRFREMTLGHPIVMGRKTLESIGRVLDGRFNFVMSRQLAALPKKYMRSPSNTNWAMVRSVDDLMENWIDPHLGAYPLLEEEEVFVIGGQQIYELFLPLADRICLTVFDAAFDGDVTFPVPFKAGDGWIGGFEGWSVADTERFRPEDEIPHWFVTLERRESQ